MMLLALHAAVLAFDFGQSTMLLTECGWDLCASQAANFSLCSEVTDEDGYCRCVAAEARRQYTGSSDECVVLIDCLIDAACSDMTTYDSQGAVSLYMGDTCETDVIFSGVFSPADGNCNRVHAAAGQPPFGVWTRASCITTLTYIQHLHITFYTSRSDCEAQTSGRVAQFDTIFDAGACRQHSEFPSYSWVMHTGACSHLKANSLLPPDVGISGTIIPSQSAWLPWLPSGTTLDNGGLRFMSSSYNPSVNCAATCDKIQLCNAWNLVDERCVLYSSTTVGLRVEGALSGRSVEKFEASCARWEATPLSATQYNIKSSWCSEACTSNPELDLCAGKRSPPYTNITAFTSCNETRVAYAFKVAADSLCHLYESADNEFSPIWVAGRCDGSTVSLAVYSSYEVCTFEGNASTPHSNSVVLEPGVCAQSGALAWVAESSCITPAPEKACRCAAITVPKGLNTGECYIHYGELRGDLIQPEVSWAATTPGTEGKDSWWTITKTDVFYACHCTNPIAIPGYLPHYVGRLCQTMDTMSCSLPTEGYICQDEGTVLCEVTDKESREAVVRACQTLCLAVPGCAGFNVDAVESKCRLLSDLQGIDSYGMFIGGDCQRGPDQECALWHMKPGNSLEWGTCAQAPTAPCSMSACHRIVAKSGNIFPTVTHCEKNCQCIIDTLSNAISARIPECGDYIACLQSTACSEWVNKPPPRTNCSCMSAGIVKDLEFADTQCCAQGACDACEAWHARGYCTLSQSNCMECGGVPCGGMNRVLVGELCGCTRYVDDGGVTDTNSVCVLDDGVRRCSTPESDLSCHGGSVLCDQCECQGNCPHAECKAFPGFREVMPTVETCKCSIYSASLTRDAKVVCTSLAYPRTCTPAFPNGTCPVGAWLPCAGTSPNKMLLVLWRLWRAEMVFVHTQLQPMVHALFLCPAQACSLLGVCPYSKEDREAAGCLNTDNGTLPMYGGLLDGFVGKPIVGGYLPTSPDDSIHVYGMTVLNSSVVNTVDMLVLHDAVDYVLRAPFIPLIPTTRANGVTGGADPVDSNCEEYCTYLSVLFPVFIVMLGLGVLYYRKEGAVVWWVHEELQQDDQDDLPSYHPDAVELHDVSITSQESVEPFPPVEHDQVVATEAFPTAQDSEPPPHQYDAADPNIGTEAFPS